MKVYISGPISGLPFEQVERDFNEAEIRLLEQGHEVINPLNNGLPLDSPWLAHMIVDIRLLLDCNAIYMLKGWKESKGATIEYNLAKELGFAIRTQIK